MNDTTISISTTIKAPLKIVWDAWTKPEHITGWAFASDDWEAPYADNDVRIGGKFKTRMSAKDMSSSFDFTGVYTKVENHKTLEYDIDDGRHVRVLFEETEAGVRVTESFNPENENSEELQRAGWKAILENFKSYAEGIKN